MNSQGSDVAEPVIPFAPRPKQGVSVVDPLDTAGQALLGMVQQAAGVAEAKSQQVRDLTARLLAADDQIGKLEQDVRYYHSRAERAEKWLVQISAEIERGFFGADDGREQPPTQQTLTRALGRKA